MSYDAFDACIYTQIFTLIVLFSYNVRCKNSIYEAVFSNNLTLIFLFYEILLDNLKLYKNIYKMIWNLLNLDNENMIK